MSPTISSNRQVAAAVPKRPAAGSPAPAPASKPAAAGDRLTLSAPQVPLERLKAQLEGPLPPAPASKPETTDWKGRDRFDRETLIKTLRQDVAVTAGLSAWKTLPPDLKLQLGQRISNIQAAIYGFKPVTLRFEDGPYRGGFHPGNGGEITIGPKSLVSAREFLNTVVHEQLHAFQWEKGNQALRKQLDPADPYAAIAPAWLDNFYAYQTPARGYRAYRDQPIEAHAFATGDQVSAAVLAKP
jgi:hypothetical protein